MNYEIWNLYISMTVKFILNSNIHKNFILKSFIKILSCNYMHIIYIFFYIKNWRLFKKINSLQKIFGNNTFIIFLYIII